MYLIQALQKAIEETAPIAESNSYNAYLHYQNAAQNQKEFLDNFLKHLVGYTFNKLIEGCDGEVQKPLTRRIYDCWWIEDVQSERPDLTDEQAAHVLEEILKRYDTTIGINWDVINDVADDLYPEPEASDNAN